MSLRSRGGSARRPLRPALFWALERARSPPRARRSGRRRSRAVCCSPAPEARARRPLRWLRWPGVCATSPTTTCCCTPAPSRSRGTCSPPPSSTRAILSGFPSWPRPQASPPIRSRMRRRCSTSPTLFPDALEPSLPIRAIVVPRIHGGRSALRPASAGAALLALAPSTAFQMPYDDGAVVALAGRRGALGARVLAGGGRRRAGAGQTRSTGCSTRSAPRASSDERRSRRGLVLSGLASVIVPAYQAEVYLEEALESALARTTIPSR